MMNITRSSLSRKELYVFSESLRRTKTLLKKKKKGGGEDKQEVLEGIIPLTYSSYSSQNSIKNGSNVPVWNVTCYLFVS